MSHASTRNYQKLIVRFARIKAMLGVPARQRLWQVSFSNRYYDQTCFGNHCSVYKIIILTHTNVLLYADLLPC